MLFNLVAFLRAFKNRSANGSLSVQEPFGTLATPHLYFQREVAREHLIQYYRIMIICSPSSVAAVPCLSPSVLTSPPVNHGTSLDNRSSSLITRLIYSCSINECKAKAG